MNRRGAAIALTLSLAFFIALAILLPRGATVSASSPPPDVPQFKGEAFTATLPVSAESQLATEAELVPLNDWTVLLEEGFEDVNWETNWTNLSVNGEPYKWDARDYPNPLDPDSERVAWAVGGASGGVALDPETDGYPANVQSWLVSGPYNLSDAIDAELTFSKSFSGQTEDTFGVGVSTNGSQFTGIQVQGGGDGSWSTLNRSLGAYAGEPQVWIAFVFTSQPDAESDGKPGPFIDNVTLRALGYNKTLFPVIAYGFTPTPVATATPLPTPTVTPLPPDSDYRDDFTSSIVPWEVRRYTDGADWDLTHRSDCDGGRCGFLQLKTETSDSYVLVSPLVAHTPPYNIQIEALFKGEEGTGDDPEAGQSYSIIFGGNWNGQACPDSPDFDTCFTNYYEFRVEYLDDDKVRAKLKQIDSHDSDNQNEGPDLFEWVDVEESGWIKWDVTVRESGQICIAAEKKPITNCITDTSYIENQYFGLMVRNGATDDARVKFDYYQVDWPDDIQALLNAYDSFEE